MAFKIENRRPSVFVRYCEQLPNGYLICEQYGQCDRCEVADRIRGENKIKKDVPLFDWRDALPQTPSGCKDFCGMPLILKPSAMERLRIEPFLINQIMIAIPSPGCLPSNPAGEIDGYLLCDPRRSFTVSRMECYGVPNTAAVKRFDEIYFLRLCRYFEKR